MKKVRLLKLGRTTRPVAADAVVIENLRRFRRVRGGLAGHRRMSVTGKFSSRQLVRQALDAAQFLSRPFLDFWAPPGCAISGERVLDPHSLSGASWGDLQLIDKPFCSRCGAPFAHAHESELTCGACLILDPAFSSVRAAFLYDDDSAGLIVRFKHSDRTEYAPLLTRMLARVAEDVVTPSSLLVPVPLHQNRLRRRKYNQAALLARRLVKTLGYGVYRPGILARRRPTKAQQALSASARARNVAGAFSVGQNVRGAHIVIVDDVMTTGHTLDACARSLMRAGAVRVDALVLGRVVNGAGGAI